MLPSIPLVSTLSFANTRTQRVLFRIAQWVGGLSLSTVILLFILFITTIVLRRKGYGVRLGLFCIIVYARPGSRRFPDGCEVRFTSRIFGFLFGGCRGPWLDISADRFYMRLRPTTLRPKLPKKWMSLLRVVWVAAAAVDRGYWSTFFRNLLTRIAAFWVRGLRIRVDKIRIWKDGGTWEYKAEQFVLAGRAVGVFGSRYSLSVNEFYVSVCKSPVVDSNIYQPVHANLTLRKGVEVIAYLTPRLFTIFRPRRLAIMDDLTFSLSVRDISCSAPQVLDASITHVAVELCPGYSRSLRAKLPPSAPATKRPQRPGILRYWEGNGAIHGLSFRFTAPMASRSANEGARVSSMSLAPDVAHASTADGTRGSENGTFVRVESVRVDAHGKAADERHEAMTHASVNVRGCSAGSTAVDGLSHSLYETLATTGEQDRHTEEGDCVESVENIDKIVAARPEALVWVEDLTAAIDINCSKRHAMRVDVAGSGGVMAIEPVGLVILVNDLRNFVSKYVERSPRRHASTSSFDTESISSLARTASSSSLQSVDTEPTSLRVVLDMRHWTMMALGHGPVGDGDTLAVVASSDTIIVPQIDFFGTSHMHIAGTTTNFVFMHWSQWARTTNVVCKEARFDINNGIQNHKQITLRKAAIDWDLDAQAGLAILPSLFRTLKELKRMDGFVTGSEMNANGGPVSLPQTPPREYDRAILSEAQLRERRERRQSKLMKILGAWQLTGTDVSFTLSFPDGPSMGLSVGSLPSIPLDAKTFVGHRVVWTMQEKRCAYGDELRLDSPLHTMHNGVEKRSITVEVQGLRIILFHDFPFGYLLQDWLLRLRSALRVLKLARMQRRGIPPEKSKNRPFPDVYFTASDVEVYFEDHPLSGFLTRMLPLMQDEARERLLREELMANQIQQLKTIARAEIAGTAKRCVAALEERHSDVWMRRVKRLKKASSGLRAADGCLPTLPFPPSSTFVAASLSFSIVMDDLVRQNGSKESIRRMKMLDDYELGKKKYNKTRHHESDAWNSIGFRGVSFEAVGVRLRFRDFNVAFAVIDRMYFQNTIFGQAVQATLHPYVAETSVAIGRRRNVKVVKGLGPTKTFADIHLVIETLQCGFNPSFLGSIAEFGRGVSRFFAGGKNPSPRIPWFDTLRVNMHGRMRISAKKFKGHLTSSISPYSMTKHYAEIVSDDFEMLTSRLEATEEDPFPISWKLYNWHIRPYSFDKKRRSEIVFDFVRVSFNPKISVLSGDPQDHYFVPFPSKEEVAAGGPGIGKGTYTLEFVDTPAIAEDNGFGNYTTWTTGLHAIPGFDSFKDFKTHSMILGLDIFVRHAEAHRSSGGNMTSEVANRPYFLNVQSPPGASVIHSDAISTLIKVVKILVRRPISCRLGPRRAAKARKPPSKTGLSSTLRGLDVTVDAKHVNAMLYNNLERGHGLFISIGSVNGELWKRTDISRTETGNVKRVSKLTRRRFNIADIFSSIRVPGLDLAVDADDMGKLLTVDKISLSDDPQDELRHIGSPSSRGSTDGPTSGFGSEDLHESPFYTFSATHPLQRGGKLDKVQYDKRLLVNRVRLIWSPVRRASVFAWPDAFKEKTFSMKAPKAAFSEEPLTRKAETRAGESFSTAKSTGGHVDHMDVSEDLVRNGSSTVAELLGDNGEEIPLLDLSTEQERPPGSRPHGRPEADLDNVAAKTAKGNRVRRGRTNAKAKLDPPPRRNDPLSPPMLAMSRSALSAVRRPGGSMVDLLGSFLSRSSDPNGKGRLDDKTQTKSQARGGALEVLKTSPKFTLFINDCQVAFGSPAASGIVFLTSNSVRVGIVDKKVQKSMQLGETNEQWSDREYRFHLDDANLFTRSRRFGDFDFSVTDWIPREGKRSRQLSLVTTNPICMYLIYISSSSLPREDTDEEDDHILRPSLLFINIPDISLSTNTDEFHATTDVVRKVLMQSMRSSELVNEELAKLRYNLQLLGGKLSSEDLDDFMRQLNNVTRQFLYAGDTFQQHLVETLMLPDEPTFSDNLLRYKAKAKAAATFMRQDQRASSKDVLYPTMYISYSFDKCSWELREKPKESNRDTEDPFVEITLDDLVCRHIFYVGRGSSTEMTFANISAQNKMRSSYFQGILQPAATGMSFGGSNRTSSRIKASDGTTVAFRWYSTQDNRVGGIPVYETLTIQVAPMTAAVTRKLYSSVYKFIFPDRSKPDGVEAGTAHSHGREGASFSRPGSSGSRPSFGSSNSVPTPEASGQSLEAAGVGRKAVSTQGLSSSTLVASMDDVNQMAQRGGSSILFKYVFIDALELTASYKNKETPARGMLDFFDLFVATPSYSYSSQVWTWKAFAGQIRKDLVMTFARRGVSNLAKIKLLPGYSRARRKLVQGADSVRESIYNRLPSAGTSTDDAQHDAGHGSDGEEGHLQEQLHNGNYLESSSSETEDDDREEAIDAAVADISGAEGMRREKILKALYGSRGSAQHSTWSSKRHGGSAHAGSSAGSVSSGERGGAHRGLASKVKPPLAPGDRSRTISTPSRGSLEEEGPRGLLGRLKRRGHEFR